MKRETVQKHEMLLYEIEAKVVEHYSEYPDLTDASVDMVYEALQQFFKAQASQRPAPNARLSPLEQGLFDDLKSICASWMAVRPAAQAQPSQQDLPKTHQDIQEALKTLRSSVRLWTKSHGRKGYLDYIDQFIL